MASIRPLLTTTTRDKTMAMVPAHSLRGGAFAPACKIETSLLKFRPLRQPQFNRNASTSTSTPAQMPPAASRSLHSSSTSRQAGAALNTTAIPGPAFESTMTSTTGNKAPLSVLPLITVLRSLAVTTISSSPVLLPPSLSIMSMLAHTTNPIMDPDRNPLLKQLIKKTIYAQFCAGETAPEIKATMAGLREIGYSGVILNYAREVVLSQAQVKALSTRGMDDETAKECIQNEVIPWARGTLETVRLAEPGDYVALKFSGAGRQALWSLSQRLAPPKVLGDAIDEICNLAAERGVRLLFDAEQHAVQAGIDDWTLQYMRRYNKTTPGKAVIYGTYQAYLKAAPSVVAAHLRAAREEGFTLGVKLVRGAYLGSDPRHLIHDTKADTDACFDGISEALLRREWTGPLAEFATPEDTAAAATFPGVNMVLASHNADSVRKARAVVDAGHTGTEVAFAQLQGMADEVSCEILAGRRGDTGASSSSSSSAASKVAAADGDKDAASSQPRAYKYLVWGSTGECMKYLLRRAQENKDAVQRTRDGRDAMRAEMWRRMKGVFGLA